MPIVSAAPAGGDCVLLVCDAHAGDRRCAGSPLALEKVHAGRADEMSDEAMRRRFEQLLGRADLHDLALRS